MRQMVGAVNTKVNKRSMITETSTNDKPRPVSGKLKNKYIPGGIRRNAKKFPHVKIGKLDDSKTLYRAKKTTIPNFPNKERPFITFWGLIICNTVRPFRPKRADFWKSWVRSRCKRYEEQSKDVSGREVYFFSIWCIDTGLCKHTLSHTHTNGMWPFATYTSKWCIRLVPPQRGTCTKNKLFSILSASLMSHGIVWLLSLLLWLLSGQRSR